MNNIEIFKREVDLTQRYMQYSLSRTIHGHNSAGMLSYSKWKAWIETDEYKEKEEAVKKHLQEELQYCDECGEKHGENEKLRKLLFKAYDSGLDMNLWAEIGEALGLRKDE